MVADDLMNSSPTDAQKVKFGVDPSHTIGVEDAEEMI